MDVHFVLHGVKYPLLQIRSEEMDEILRDGQSRWLTGYPQYFDDKGRIWPKPEPGIKIENTPPVEE